MHWLKGVDGEWAGTKSERRSGKDEASSEAGITLVEGEDVDAVPAIREGSDAELVCPVS